MSVTDQHRPGTQQEIDVFPAGLVPNPPAAALTDNDIAGEVAEGAAGENAFRLLESAPARYPVLDPAHTIAPSVARQPSGTIWRARDRKIVVRFIRRRAMGSNGSRRCIVGPLSHITTSPTCQS